MHHQKLAHSTSLIKMEQYSQYLKSNNNILMNRVSGHSWEEQAFAEDARGPLGGFVWPPRSYFCSFCMREFRSAQALGGHMNVHRREKAKFKESVDGTTPLSALQNNHYKEMSVCNKDSLSVFFPTRVSSSSGPHALGQESLDSSCDTKSCVYDGIGDHVETDLGLGFDLDSCWSNNKGGGKRMKRNHDHVTPPIMGGLDLELRLAYT